MPKKKLPTGPIRIDPPISKPKDTEVSSHDARTRLTRKPDSSYKESNKAESSKTESSQEDSELQPPAFKPDSITPETIKLDYSKPESHQLELTRLETSKPETAMKESSTEYNPTPASLESIKPESSKLESIKPDSSLREYKKVAMRLSVEAVESLRQFRSETGIPYEILVDVMVKNWEDLPQRTQSAYLKQAQLARNERLLAGQEKAIKTMRKKLSDEG